MDKYSDKWTDLGNEYRNEKFMKSYKKRWDGLWGNKTTDFGNRGHNKGPNHKKLKNLQ